MQNLNQKKIYICSCGKNIYDGSDICDNDCNTVICRCGKEYYFIVNDQKYSYYLGHDPKCGEDESEEEFKDE